MVPSEVWALILSKMPPGGPPPKVPLLGTRPCPDHPKKLVYGGISRVHFRASRLSESRNCFAERLHWCTAIRTSLESTGGRILERPVAIFKIPGNPAGQPAGLSLGRPWPTMGFPSNCLWAGNTIGKTSPRGSPAAGPGVDVEIILSNDVPE